MVSSTPQLHFTPRKDLVPILQEAGWAPGPDWTGGKSRPHRDSIPDRPARSQSLYQLSYVAHTNKLLPVRISFSISYLLISPWLYCPLGALASLILGTYSSLCTTFCCSLLTFISRSSYNFFLVFHDYCPTSIHY